MANRIYTGFRMDAELARGLRVVCAERGERIQDRLSKLIAGYLRRVESRKKQIDKNRAGERCLPTTKRIE